MTGLDLSTRPPARRAGSAAEGILLGASALVCAWAVWGCVQSWRDVQRTQAVVNAARRDAEAAQSRARSLEGNPDAGGEAVLSRIVWTAEAPPSRVFAELTALLPGDARLTDVTLAYGTKLELDLHLVARQTAAYDLFLKRLGDSSRFQDVVPGPEARDGGLQASVHLSYRKAAAP